MDDSAWSRWSAYEAVLRALSVQLCGTMWSYADASSRLFEICRLKQGLGAISFASWDVRGGEQRLMVDANAPTPTAVGQCWFMDPEPGPLWTLITAIWKDSSRVLGKVTAEITWNYFQFLHILAESTRTRLAERVLHVYEFLLYKSR